MNSRLAWFPKSQANKLLRIYTWSVMLLLLIQGSGSLLLRLQPALEAQTPLLLATIMNGNPPHAILHIGWGLVGVGILAFLPSDQALLRLSATFGIFYTLLGFLGIIVHDPFGMRLAWQENLFHLTIGPLMLLLVYLVRF